MNRLPTKATDLWYRGTMCAPDDITGSKVQSSVNPITHISAIWGCPLPRISLELTEPVIRPP